ncbi:TLR4 interactor with leucine rich repeats-like [Astyanax mexicanus]|uniref:TLR4 interactor with leucine rich repeats-like n=1 Tax=Astyanax mexicanus TaxID=7994 RepID=A0A8T2LIX7_ASTMX|nr:TLR4 interactor with leucine rich repeats-like [Astyanax mexicanus]
MVRIFIFCLFYTSLCGHFLDTCPTVCECRNGELFCMNSGLSHLLWLQSTKHLRLAGNLVDCIRPSGLQLYTNLTVWDLETNAKFFNFVSFYYLWNLTSLDLNVGHFDSSILDCNLLASKIDTVNMDKLNDVQQTVHYRRVTQQRSVTLKSLEIILLDHVMRIESLAKNTFKGQQSLQRLNLSGNRLSRFSDSILRPLSSLAELILDENLLSEIRDSNFRELRNLKVLSLSHNRLSWIHPSAFKGLHKLEVLKLKGNYIFMIKKVTFQYCRKLRDIDLSDNAISHLDNFTFSGLPHLRRLKLNNNRLLQLNPQVFGSSAPQLQFLDLTGNTWKCVCRFLSLKSWLESGRNGLVIVKCSHPERLKGQYLHTIRGALIRSGGGPRSRARTSVQSKPTHSGSGSRVTRQTCHDGDRYHTHRRVGRTAPQLLIKHTEEGSSAEPVQYQDESAGGALATQNIQSAPERVARSPSNSTRKKVTENSTGSDACSYNQLAILNISAVTVTSSSALIKWTLAKNTAPNVHFRVMYDHFHTRTRFSRFVSVKQGTTCNLCDLRPSTPYLVCVESVVDEKVCHVASRELCLGIITKPEEMSGPEPQTIILYLSGVNTFAILALLALFARMGCVLRKRLQADALTLLYSREKSISCAMCAGIPMSDRTSGMNTSSSHTGTYQQSDAIDAIDLPATR